MTLLQPVGYDRPVPVAPGVTAEFINAGHLLGSATRACASKSTGKTILFGGDLGRYGRPVLPDPAPVAEADVLLVESTYGNRVHEPDDDGARLARDHQRRRSKRGGKVIIPAFALGRVEELLYWINGSKQRTADSRAAGLRGQPDGGGGPRAVSRARRRARSRDLAAQGATAARARAASVCRVLHGEAEGHHGDRRIARRPGIARRRRSSSPSSGMATGGRVLHHLARALPDRAQHRAVRRLTRRPARAAALLKDGAPIHAHPRPGRPGRARDIESDRFDVGARRRERDHALASAASSGRRR